jgi:hypothetical protein
LDANDWILRRSVGDKFLQGDENSHRECDRQRGARKLMDCVDRSDPQMLLL